MLEYVGVPYENRVMIMPKPDWLEYKKSLGFDFPNLPYYQEGDLKLTQSSAILRHVARKHDLEGKTEAEKARADMLADVLGDYRDPLVKLCYNPEFSPDLIPKFAGASLKERMGNLER